MASDAIAVIPARGGSTRIPRKNIAAFNGKPMIAWAIGAALATPAISRVVVSTDDEEIAQVARDHGAEVPFIRPAELADNFAGTAPVIRHAIDAIGIAEEVPVVCIYPTAAISESLLSDALQQFANDSEVFLVSVGRHRSPFERALLVKSPTRMFFEHPDFLTTRTQDLPTRYFDAGKFYIASPFVWRNSSTMLVSPFAAFPLPDWASVDLDEPDDWPIAEALHRTFGSSGVSNGN